MTISTVTGTIPARGTMTGSIARRRAIKGRRRAYWRIRATFGLDKQGLGLDFATERGLSFGGVCVSRVPSDGANVVLLTPRDTAERLQVSIDQLRGFVHDGELRYVNLGRGRKKPRMMFTEGDITEFIARRTRRHVECPSTNRSAHHILPSTSKSKVIGFTARLSAKRDAKRKP